VFQEEIFGPVIDHANGSLDPSLVVGTFGLSDQTCSTDNQVERGPHDVGNGLRRTR
jgi:hypothetical protein